MLRITDRDIVSATQGVPYEVERYDEANGHGPKEGVKYGIRSNISGWKGMTKMCRKIIQSEKLENERKKNSLITSERCRNRFPPVSLHPRLRAIQKGRGTFSWV